MEKLFGTDGIRGPANTYPMTPEIAVQTGRAVADFFGRSGLPSRVVIGKDSRISGDMLAYALASGVCSAGCNAVMAGIIPTPGVAFLAASLKSCAGIVVSASHNPFFDNGIKIFKGNGYKLSDREEADLERLILDQPNVSDTSAVRDTGRVERLSDGLQRYARFLKGTFPAALSLAGARLVLDCSNGATSAVAPGVFSELGADVTPLFNQPDGKNINAECGSQHPEKLADRVVQTGADAGFAFDGDGDRLICVDETGRVLTGDQVLAVCAHFLRQHHRLPHNRVVSTIMSNMGLGAALERMGITHVKSGVGDRRVLEKMISRKAVLGGEDSGHMIFLDHHTTGDGILAALQVLAIMRTEARPLSELAGIMTVFPQTLINVAVARKPEISSVPEITDAIRSVEKKLENEGRVLVRYSGTQPLCRIMVEGPTEESTRSYCRQISAVVAEMLG